MESAELRKMAQVLRTAAAESSSSTREKAAHVVSAALALELLRKKVQAHGE